MCFSKGAGGATSPSGSGISAFLISCTKYPGVRRTTESERKLHCLHFLECCRVDLQLLLMVLITLQHQGLAILFIHFSNNAHTEVFKKELLRVVGIKHTNLSLPWKSAETSKLQRFLFPNKYFLRSFYHFTEPLLLLHTAIFCQWCICVTFCQKETRCSLTHTWNKKCSNKAA